jgi:hypothetical protein
MSTWCAVRMGRSTQGMHGMSSDGWQDTTRAWGHAIRALIARSRWSRHGAMTVERQPYGWKTR